MNDVLPRVSIGLPTYNRPELLALVLRCFQRQTFEDFELIISDNASPNPQVRQLCEKYAQQDSRFRYIRQARNLGAEENFWFVYDQARAPLFMWASDDDLWPANFLEKGIAALEKNPGASAWFCQIVNINVRGEVVRSYPSFKRFQSAAPKFIELVRFLWEPEIMGKANLIYSLFRRPVLLELVEIFRRRPSTWGSDMNLVYGYLCRGNLVVDDQVVLQKRIPAEAPDPILGGRLRIYPRDVRAIYFQSYLLAAAGSGYWLLTNAVLAARTPYGYWYSGEALEDYRVWRGRLFRGLRRLRSRLTGTETASRE